VLRFIFLMICRGVAPDIPSRATLVRPWASQSQSNLSRCKRRSASTMEVWL